MSVDTRKKNTNWRLNIDDRGTVGEGQAQLAVLMDIRDELQMLNKLLGCSNFTTIPQVLRGIRRKIPTKKKSGG